MLDPLELHLSILEISQFFSDGSSIQQLAQALAHGTVLWKNIKPPVHVYYHDGEWFVKINKVLAALRLIIMTHPSWRGIRLPFIEDDIKGGEI